MRELAELGRMRAAPRGPLEEKVAAVAAESEIVPIESLLAEPPATEMTAFARSFSTWFRLEHETGPLAVEAAPADLAGEAEAVPIGNLLYRGRRALERADVLRRELETILKTTRDFDLAEPLLGELLDLVPLALAD